MRDARAFARTKGDDVKRSVRIYRRVLHFYPREDRNFKREESTHASRVKGFLLGQGAHSLGASR
jgi:hypothetical protein